MIALLTDFGDDYYVGVMKGVIHSINKRSDIIDITHAIKPHNVRQGAWILLQSFSYFPKHTVFLAVVDPGVGSQRKAIIIETRNYFFIGPDNGILQPAAKKDGIIEILALPINKKSSKTFHGRDVFAKIAAQLEKGIKPKELGHTTSSIKEFSFSTANTIGEVVHIDAFGNVITNFRPLLKNRYTLRWQDREIDLLFFDTYDAAPQNTPFLITGSANTLEISIKNGSARSFFNINLGDTIEIS